jgi:hypothetical protein
MKPRRRALAIAFASLLAASLSFSVATFAWIQYRQNLEKQIEIGSGSLAIDSLSLAPYKVFYPDFLGSYASTDELIDYAGVTAVNPTPNRGFAMNILDPSYLTINPDKTISDLLTNLVFKVSFAISYSTPLSVNLSVKKKSVVLQENQFRASDCLHFTAVPPDASAAYGSLSATDVFYGIKSYAEETTDEGEGTVLTHPCSIFGSADSIDLLGADGADLVTAEGYSPSHGNPQSFFFFVNVDYDRGLCDYFFDITRLGNGYELVPDYFFSLTVSQKR